MALDSSLGSALIILAGVLLEEGRRRQRIGRRGSSFSRLCLLEYRVDEETVVTRLARPDARQQEILRALGVQLPAK